MKARYSRIGLINPKTPANVGSVMRAAGCYQVDEVFYTGRRYSIAAQFNTDTQGVSEHIPLVGVEDLTQDLPKDCKIVCVELVEGATPLPDYQHPEKAVYIFGPEDGNAPQAIVDRADDVVYIPTIGCMNLAATVNVVLYDRLAKLNSEIASDTLILKSRDQNSKLKVPPRNNT